MIHIATTHKRNPDFALLCRELDDYLNELAGGEENRAEYIPHNAPGDIYCAVIASFAGDLAGCAGLKKLDGETAELKRVFVRERYRRRRIARQMVEALEKRARASGYRRLVLETGEALEAAIRLYRAMGYEVIQNYGPYRLMPDSICMGKAL